MIPDKVTPRSVSFDTNYRGGSLSWSGSVTQSAVIQSGFIEVREKEVFGDKERHVWHVQFASYHL